MSDWTNRLFAKTSAEIEEAYRTKAVKLDLSHYGLSKLPESISRLAHLKKLYLSYNQLTELPESIDELTQLEVLEISNNFLSKCPDSIIRLSYLESLNLSGNRLIALPESIGQLLQLRILYAGLNQLTSLPESIGQLINLQELHLFENRWFTLPESITKLTQLQKLNLSGNELKTLPESIGQLTLLEYLNLSNNQLIGLPESLRNLGLLQQLYLHQNDRLELPREVLGPASHNVAYGQSKPINANEILRYYFQLRGGRRPLNEAKLILVGRGAVGKTSIVNRLVHNQYDQNERKTEGIRITEWKLKLNKNEPVRLNIWDFGGQEIMHATHQFFLTQRSLYLLVLNGREGGEDADAEYWLKLIESFGDESPIIIVLNKIREHPFDLNRRTLRQKYTAICDFIKTDCENGIGIDELRKAIERETNRLEHLRDAFPSSWFMIKDQLMGMERNYLSFDEYRRLCEQYGERDAAAQESLAGYLHNLGIILNYKDDPRLQDTHVLNPHWVTNGIYKILNSDKLEKQKGEVRLSTLSKFLDSTEYPASIRRFIFDLMKKFDLCFSFPEDDANYLIPELLDKQQPEDINEFELAGCLNFQYHYPILPEGLLPRFVVRTHVLSEGLARWRTGVILSFEGCHALVKADMQDKIVYISVSGPALSRRRLLAVIRSDLERIHRDIRNLQPQEMVPLPKYPNVVIPYQELIVMERNGMKTFPKVVHNQVIELDVQELLNGIDIEGTRRKQRMIDEHKRVIRLFYSYSHKDENLRNELETHLKLLQRQRLIETWHDRKIEAGEDWRQKIDDNLQRADIILLLVSADFIASDYCYEKEMKRALERHENAEAYVIPVIVRNVTWERAPFANLQALPKGGLAVTKWTDRDSAWRDVSEGIERVAEGLRQN